MAGRLDVERINAFRKAEPEIVDFLIANGMRFGAGNRICEIYGDRPGAGTGGRPLIAAPFDVRSPGKRVALLRNGPKSRPYYGLLDHLGEVDDPGAVAQSL